MSADRQIHHYSPKLARRCAIFNIAIPEGVTKMSRRMLLLSYQATLTRPWGGRAFLHDYDVAKDPDFAVLTLIMTAPLIVANWINMQYYGSIVDNQRQGCGNKVLHNVVGGTIGVLEGNGGDLRIGLSEQSLRDSNGGLQHEPLRLSAFIEAPTEVMDRIIGNSTILGQLVDNRWLTIVQIAPDGSLFERRAKNQWVLM